MRNEVSDLKQQLFAAGTDAPRELVVRYVKALVREAAQLPVPERDVLAYEILRPFVELDIPTEDDSELDYIVFQLVGSDLDTNREQSIRSIEQRSNPRASHWRQFKENKWQELIERTERLQGV